MPAKTKKQQKFFGAVMSAKKGKKNIKGPAAKAAKSMSKKQIKDFLHKETFEEYYYSNEEELLEIASHIVRE